MTRRSTVPFRPCRHQASPHRDAKRSVFARTGDSTESLLHLIINLHDATSAPLSFVLRRNELAVSFWGFTNGTRAILPVHHSTCCDALMHNNFERTRSADNLVGNHLDVRYGDVGLPGRLGHFARRTLAIALTEDRCSSRHARWQGSYQPPVPWRSALASIKSLCWSSSYQQFGSTVHDDTALSGASGLCSLQSMSPLDHAKAAAANALHVEVNPNGLSHASSCMKGATGSVWSELSREMESRTGRSETNVEWFLRYCGDCTLMQR